MKKTKRKRRLIVKCNYDLLNKEGAARFNKALIKAWARYQRIRCSAWKKYEQIQYLADEEYKRSKEKSYCYLFRQKKYRQSIEYRKPIDECYMRKKQWKQITKQIRRENKKR